MFAFRMFEAAVLSDRFVASLKVIEAEHPTAAKQGKTECCHSGVCCWRRPGNLIADDVPKLAALLGLTPQELFQRYLVVDVIQGRKCLLPARKHQAAAGEAGQMVSWRETYSIESPCVFLGDNNACTVYEARPHACRTFECWNPTTHGDIDEIADSVLRDLGWDGRDVDDDEDDDEGDE